MPTEGQRSIVVCRQCGSALAARVLADGSIRPIGAGTQCSCGGESFEEIGELEPGDGPASGGDERSDRTA